MIMEFGIKHDIWWKKMDQILQYVQMLLCDNQDCKYAIDLPILLTVVTVNPRSKQSKCDTISETIATDNTTGSVYDAVPVEKNEANPNDTDQKERTVDVNREVDTNTTSTTSSTNANTENDEEKLDVRFGVFLCIPRHSNDDGNKYRVALLWRKKTSTVEDASYHFGKILCAAQLCADWREQIAAKCKEAKETDKEAFYQYLGPNCCRIGTRVSKCILSNETYIIAVDFAPC